MAAMRCALSRMRVHAGPIRPLRSASVRYLSSKSLSDTEINELLSKPSWSVKALLHGNNSNDQPEITQPEITQKQLHHLLRLSALSLPETAEEEASMIDTLRSQLHFVRAIQNVDTTGVQPLQSVRDETAAAEAENEITLETLKAEMAKEKQVGFARRIVREEETAADQANAEHFDAVSQAPKKLGRYIVVNTKED